jgi:flagellar M-ring protein FliF
MANGLNDFGDRFGSLVRNMGIGQKVAIVAVIVASLGGLFGIINWASAPDYVPLFSNLPPDDAGKIADWLNENNIEYKLEQGGSRILVTRENQYQARIQLAQEGLPGKRSTGYEIFDETNLGMSEFVQKLNFRRALEGELSRTIESIDEIEQARVHIVIPEQALFREKEQQPTASVALKLQKTISQDQVLGISHLIASAVEGLDANEITIIDSRGNVLSNMSEKDPLVAMTTTQMRLKADTEENLTKKVETMLTQLLGPEKSIVRVSVDLDFTRMESMSENYDPDQTAVRSEEIIESSSTKNDQNQLNPVDPTQPPLGKSDEVTETNSITNYEVSKTVTNTFSSAGGIERISASVLIDGRYETVEDADGNPAMEYRNRDPREMQMIEEAVRSALGLNDDRGDQLSVQNIAFQAPETDVMPPETMISWLQSNGLDLLRNILIGVAVIGILVFVRNLLNRSSQAAREVWERRLAALPTGHAGGAAFGALPGAAGAGGEALALPDIDSDLPPEVIEANQLQQQLVEFTTEKPEVAARLLKTWLVEQ